MATLKYLSLGEIRRCFDKAKADALASGASAAEALAVANSAVSNMRQRFDERAGSDHNRMMAIRKEAAE